jgi:peptide/nickel transport system permease protein
MISIADIYKPPSALHIFGTDDAGQDVFSNFVFGARISLTVGFFAAFISIIIGGTFGLVAGFFGGRWENFLMRFTDIMLVIPDLPLMVVIVALTKPSLLNIIFVIGLLGWTTTARVVRSQTLAVKSRKFVLRARAIGAGRGHIVSRHILPMVMPILVVQAVLVISLAILNESALAFLGLGDPTTLSWGQMLNYVITVAISAFFVPHYFSVLWDPLASNPGDILFGVALVAALVAINVIGSQESARLNVVLAVGDLATQVLLVCLGIVLVLSPETLVSNVEFGVAPTWGDFALGIALGRLGRRLHDVEPRRFASAVQCAFRFNSYVALALSQRLGGDAGVALCAIVCNNDKTEAAARVREAVGLPGVGAVRLVEQLKDAIKSGKANSSWGYRVPELKPVPKSPIVGGELSGLLQVCFAEEARAQGQYDKALAALEAAQVALAEAVENTKAIVRATEIAERLKR